MARRPTMLAAAVALALVVAGGIVWLVRRDDDTREERLGLNTHVVWAEAPEVEETFASLHAGGVAWVREEFPWRELEPQRGTFSWQRTDALMSAAARQGVNVLAILAYSAPWASSDPSGAGETKYPPRDPRDYARYAAAVVERYGAGGAFWREREDLDARPISAVEIWNEPFTHTSWRPDPDPAAYARLVRAAADAIHRVRDDVEILIAGDLLQVRTDGAVEPWLQDLLAADRDLASVVDAYSVHPYPDPRTLGPYDDRTDGRWDFRRVVASHDVDPRLPIWITEIGWSTAQSADSVSEATQADYLTGAVVRALRSWGGFVQRIFVYSFDRDTGDRGDREGHYGLIRSDGTPKPAWRALSGLDLDAVEAEG